MCSPSPMPPDAIGLYCADNHIILSLQKLNLGSPLPDDVINDVNPYQNLPFHMPPDIWYLVSSTGPKETEHGFWKAKGDACEIFENSVIRGWRTTLEFFEGGQKTDWVMQEYRITQKGAQKDSPKRSRALCRVFHCRNGSPKADKGSFSSSVPLVCPETNSISDGGSTMESQTKSITIGTSLPEVHETRSGDFLELEDLDEGTSVSSGDFLELNDLDDDGTRELPPEVSSVEHLYDEEDVSCRDYLELDDLDKGIAVEKPRSPLYEDFADPISRGAYLELNDLADYASHSSSSAFSSHRKSDEFFALLRDRDDDRSQDLLQGMGSSFHRNVMGSVRPNEIILQPAPSEPIISTSRGETQRGDRPRAKSSGKAIKDPNVKRPKPDYRTDASSNASSSRHRKKFKKYFCFLPF